MDSPKEKEKPSTTLPGTVTEEVTRCPFCVQDNHFKPMVSPTDGSFVCLKCFHRLDLADPKFRCFCMKYEQLNGFWIA
jgi:hypothetical protein